MLINYRPFLLSITLLLFYYRFNLHGNIKSCFNFCSQRSIISLWFFRVQMKLTVCIQPLIQKYLQIQKYFFQLILFKNHKFSCYFELIMFAIPFYLLPLYQFFVLVMSLFKLEEYNFPFKSLNLVTVDVIKIMYIRIYCVLKYPPYFSVFLFKWGTKLFINIFLKTSLHF